MVQERLFLRLVEGRPMNPSMMNKGETIDFLRWRHHVSDELIFIAFFLHDMLSTFHATGIAFLQTVLQNNVRRVLTKAPVRTGIVEQ